MEDDVGTETVQATKSSEEFDYEKLQRYCDRLSNFVEWTSTMDLLNRSTILLDYGLPVSSSDGKYIEDSNSKSGFLRAPEGTNLFEVAEAGRMAKHLVSASRQTNFGENVSELILMAYIGAHVGTGGKFDYQRKFNSIGEMLKTGEVFSQLRQYRDVSGVTVGLFMQQAGYTLEETLQISGEFARSFSRNSKPDLPYSLDPRTLDFIKDGYTLGDKGIYDKK